MNATKRIPTPRLVRVTDIHGDVVYDPQRQPVLHRLMSERRVKLVKARRAQATRRVAISPALPPRPAPFLALSALMFALAVVLAVAVWP